MSIYRALSDRLVVPLCTGITRTGHYCALPEGMSHDGRGCVHDGIVHWRDRQRSRAGLTMFLRLVAQARDPSLADDEPWRRVYRTHLAVMALQKEAGVRLASRNDDRAFVLAAVAGLPNTEPLRKRAFDWARRPRKAGTSGSQP